MSLHVGNMTRAKLPSDVIVRLPEPEISNEVVTVLAGSGTPRALEIGTVLGRISASGKVVQLTPAAEDGSQTAWGVLISNTTAPVGTDAIGTAVARLAALRADGLIWPTGISDANKAAALAALAVNMIVAR